MRSARLERHVGFLATTGSVAPFIGLMGTVWGVMAAFVNIGAQGSASLVVVAPGIAEALIATVAGLAAAIPAVVGYNHCLGRLREIGNGAAQFTSEFLDRRLGAHLVDDGCGPGIAARWPRSTSRRSWTWCWCCSSSSW